MPKIEPSSPESNESESSEFKYFAFISYSRADDRAAKWLQKRLVWFPFPVKIVAADHRPPHPKYLRPIYRDKTHLDNTHVHYWQNIRAAIEQSRFLIVLCSPHSAKSEPVNLEVKHFLTSRSSEFLVPVILSGRVTSNGEDASLCPALRDLGKDLISRNLPTMIADTGDPEREGWENGFIGVLVNLLGLKRESLADHVRRDERKRAARVRVVAVVFAALAITAGILGWMAKQNQDKAISAERQTAEQLAKTEEQRQLAQVNAKTAAEQRELAEQRAKEALDAKAEETRQRQIADQNAKDAAQQRDEAEKQSGLANKRQIEAEEARRLSEEQKSQALRAEYETRLGLISSLISSGQSEAARQELLGISPHRRDSAWALLFTVIGPGASDARALAAAKNGLILPGELAEIQKFIGRQSASLKNNDEESAPALREIPLGRGYKAQINDNKGASLIIARTPSKSARQFAVFEAGIGYFGETNFTAITSDGSSLAVGIVPSLRDASINHQGDSLGNFDLELYPLPEIFLGTDPTAEIGDAIESLSVTDKGSIESTNKGDSRREFQEWLKSNRKDTHIMTDFRIIDGESQALVIHAQRGVEWWDTKNKKILGTFGPKPSKRPPETFWETADGRCAIFAPDSEDEAILFLKESLVRISLKTSEVRMEYKSAPYPDGDTVAHIGDGTYYSKGTLSTDGNVLCYHFGGKHEQEHYIWDYHNGEMLESFGRFSLDTAKVEKPSPYDSIVYANGLNLWIFSTSTSTHAAPRWNSTPLYCPGWKWTEGATPVIKKSQDGKYAFLAGCVFSMDNGRPVFSLPSSLNVNHGWSIVTSGTIFKGGDSLRSFFGEQQDEDSVSMEETIIGPLHAPTFVIRNFVWGWMQDSPAQSLYSMREKLAYFAWRRSMEPRIAQLPVEE